MGSPSCTFTATCYRAASTTYVSAACSSLIEVHCFLRYGCVYTGRPMSACAWANGCSQWALKRLPPYHFSACHHSSVVASAPPGLTVRASPSSSIRLATVPFPLPRRQFCTPPCPPQWLLVACWLAGGLLRGAARPSPAVP